MPNKNYIKGYNLERYCFLTLEYNGFHIIRKYRSVGVEDIVAIRKDQTLLVQVKSGNATMDLVEQEILKRHAKDIGAIPIYLFQKDKQKIWVSLLTNDYYDLKKYTIDWYIERNKIKKEIKAMKKKSKAQCNRYILNNWVVVKNYIC